MNALELLQELYIQIPRPKTPKPIFSLVLNTEKDKLVIHICDHTKVDRFFCYGIDPEDYTKEIKVLVGEIKEMEDKRK